MHHRPRQRRRWPLYRTCEEIAGDDGKLTSSRVRRGQRCPFARRLRDQRAAVAVGRGDKARGHVLPRSATFAMWVPSLTNKTPPVSLLFSEYPSVVWTPKGITRQIDAFLRTKVRRHLAGEGRGVVEPQRAGWTCKGRGTTPSAEGVPPQPPRSRGKSGIFPRRRLRVRQKCGDQHRSADDGRALRHQLTLSGATAAAVENNYHATLDGLQRETKSLLLEHWPKVKRVAKALFVDHAEVERLMAGGSIDQPDDQAA
jgi:hypothetical protein